VEGVEEVETEVEEAEAALVAATLLLSLSHGVLLVFCCCWVLVKSACATCFDEAAVLKSRQSNSATSTP
jgi:flagellar biogenesis protein FliO